MFKIARTSRMFSDFIFAYLILCLSFLLLSSLSTKVLNPIFPKDPHVEFISNSLSIKNKRANLLS
jgi:hypothetical protein